MVKPGHALSLQLHHHRAEHWVVVSGTAKVTRYLIEVQPGSYLGEDDILRFDDRYKR